MNHDSKSIVVALALALFLTSAEATLEKCAKIFCKVGECEQSISATKAPDPPKAALATPIPRNAARERFDQIVQQLRTISRSGVVVYAVIPGEQGMTLIRAESAADGAVSTTQIAHSQMNEATFRKVMGRIPTSGDDAFAADALAPLRIASRQADENKTVFLLDANAYGLIPDAFGLEKAVILGSATMEKALNGRHRMLSEKGRSEEFTALFSIPRTPEEYIRTFGKSEDKSPYPPLKVWEPVAEAADQLAKSNQLKVIGKSALQELAESKGIVSIIAHSDGAAIRLGDGSQVRVTPQDIAKIRFRHAPFVFLRVCQPRDIGFAQAFLAAGASGVSTNRGVVSAQDAMRDATVFLASMNRGLSIAEAIDEVTIASGGAPRSTVTVTMRAPFAIPS